MIRRSRLYRAAIITLLLCAFALRIYELETQSLWYDEGVTATVAQFAPLQLIRWTAEDIQPPLYYFVVAGWGQVAGWSEWSLRVVSVWFGTLTVPMISVLARRLLRSSLAALIAALITAFHPLLVYYSQEARMYAMLVGLGVLTGYCIVRYIDSDDRDPGDRQHASAVSEARSGRGPHWHWLAGYIFAGSAAIYTHYFAFFLLIALGIACTFHQYVKPSTQSFSSRFRTYLWSNLAVAIIYLPWFQVLVTQLEVDASYWEGTLKLWDALRAIWIRFTLGETVLEIVAVRFIWIQAAITLIALAALIRAVTRTEPDGGDAGDGSLRTSAAPATGERLLCYSLAWLLFPTVAILALASVTPKFNPRYTMIALPGLILLWSGGIAAVLNGGAAARRLAPGHDVDRRGNRMNVPPRQIALRASVALLLLSSLLAGFLYVNLNWFTDPAFTKDQWRELVTHVQANRQEDEGIVLVSGHAWPIWNYYAGDAEAIRLPDLRTLDVNAVLDFSNTAQPLRSGLVGMDGAWLVGWQDEVVDPMGVTGLQLRRAGDEHAVDAEFWGLRLRHFTGLEPETISATPPIQTSANVNFGNVVQLVGYRIDDDGDLLLFWQLHPGSPLQSRLPDLYLTGQTLNADGLPYADLSDRRLSDYNYPSFRWQPDQVAFGHVSAEEWAGLGAPEGNYQLRLGVYEPGGDPAGLDVRGPGGSPQGKRTALSLSLPKPIPLMIEDEPGAQWHQTEAGVFVMPGLNTKEAMPGQPVRLTMHWYTTRTVTLDEMVLTWNRETDSATVPGERLPLHLELEPNSGRRTVHQIRPPVDLHAGEYRLELSLDGLSTPGDGAARGAARRTPVQIEFTVLPGNRRFDLPSLARSIEAEFGDKVSLAGLVDTVPTRVEAGETLALTLAWQATQPMEEDFSATVQFLDESGQPARQTDQLLPGGTSNWLSAEVVTGTVRLAVPNKPGAYRLIAAVYRADEPGLPRLPLESGNDFVDLGRIQVQ